MATSQYSLGYTTGAALISESMMVAGLYQELGDWKKVRQRVIDDNSLQSRTISTLKKIYGEVSKRLYHLTGVQMNLLATGEDDEIKALIWLSICRQYKFINDFTIEVLGAQYASSRFLLTYDDYEAFFNAKAQWHKNLDETSRSTRNKVRQVLFKMLKECNLIDAGNDMMKQRLSEKVIRIISDDSRDDLLLFPGLTD